MSQHPSLISSISGNRCPKCRQGALFAPVTLTKPGSYFQMNPSCAYCGQTFEPEPGFYFGAMFISYALNTALFISIWVIYANLTEDFSILMLLGIMTFAAVVLIPVFFRLSRTLWIYIFVRFDPKIRKN
jgi:uncharacterized protein (DUF983 family)